MPIVLLIIVILALVIIISQQRGDNGRQRPGCKPQRYQRHGGTLGHQKKNQKDQPDISGNVHGKTSFPEILLGFSLLLTDLS